MQSMRAFLELHPETAALLAKTTPISEVVEKPLSPRAGPRAWFILLVEPGMDNRVRNGLEELGAICWMAEKTVLVKHARRSERRQVPLLPGYLFVDLPGRQTGKTEDVLRRDGNGGYWTVTQFLVDYPFAVAKAVEGVIDMLGSNGRPRIVPREQIDRFRIEQRDGLYDYSLGIASGKPHKAKKPKKGGDGVPEAVAHAARKRRVSRSIRKTKAWLKSFMAVGGFPAASKSATRFGLRRTGSRPDGGTSV